MRSLMLSTVILVSLTPTLARAATTVQHGAAALASYEQVSDDGCVVTSGEIAVLDAVLPGENPAGVYVTAIQQDMCDPADFGRGYAGYLAAGNFHVLGVSSGRFAGTLEAAEYSGSGAAPLTFEVDLHWHGTGAINKEKQYSNEDGVLTYYLRATRAAFVSGSFTIDGETGTLTSGSLVSETLVIVAN